MFRQKNSFSNSVLNNVVRSEIDLFYLRSVEVPFEWLSRLKAETIAKRIYSLLKLSDIDVSAEVVSKIVADDPGRDEDLSHLVSRLKLVIRERDLQAILNLLTAIRYVDQIGFIAGKFSQESVSSKEVLQINKLLGERLLANVDFGYRKNEGYGVDVLVHEVPFQFEDFLEWINSDTSKETNPIVVYAIIVLEFMKIAPFDFYCIETGLLFASSVLISRKYNMDYVCFEEDFLRHKLRIEDALRSKMEDAEDRMLDMVIEIVAKSVARAKSKILNIGSVSLKYRESTGRAVALTERQLAIMEEMTSKEMVTIKEIRSVLPMVSDDTILRDIKDLVLKKMIKKKGKTKGAVYVIGKVKG